MNLPRIDTSNLWDKTYVLLKDRILRRDFKPNEKLSIPDLAAQLGVSRTPIRDALNRLEKDGLVKTVSKVGTFINALEVREVVEIMDTRLMLDLWVVEKLAAMPKTEVLPKVTHLEKLLDDTYALLKHSSVKAFLRTDHNRTFHLAFIDLGNNRRNADIYSGMLNYLFLASEHSFYTEEMVASAVDEHFEILRALKRGLRTSDFSELKRTITQHLDDVRTRLIRGLEARGGQL